MVAGDSLGPYRILAKVGEGGMGEVYRALDTRLQRTVAIKLLPASLARDPQFRARLEREAHAISQLDHPHICTLYDVGEEDSTPYLVMQYLEGHTLEQRLESGALPIEQALSIAVQMAEALDAAHRRGIVHRDLKPANVMLTKAGVKLLDFGVAKTAPPAGVFTADTVSPTMAPTMPGTLTAQGSIVGTVQYMAPEQIEGAEADARTDIFACGAVLYEMVTGRRAFEGGTAPALMSAILKDTPAPLASHQPLTPPALERLVAACLAKAPDERWQSAGDLARELRWISTSGTAPAGAATPRGATGSSRSQRLAWTVAALSLVAALAVGARAMGLGRPAPPQPAVIRASVAVPAGTSLFEVSPDGHMVAFVAPNNGGTPALWILRLDSAVPQPVAGTEGAVSPFWAPDSRRIGFFAGGQMKIVSADRGGVQVVTDVAPVMTINATAASASSLSASWGAGDTILFKRRPEGGLVSINATGGTVTEVTRPAEGAAAEVDVYPFFLPNSPQFLFLRARVDDVDNGGVYLASLDGGEPRRVLDFPTRALFVDGRVVFAQNGTILARRFTPSTASVSGDPVVLAEGVTDAGARQIPQFTVSSNGVLLFQQRRAADSQLTWFGRTGQRLGTVGDAADQISVELAPGGARALVSILDRARGTRDIWQVDTASGQRTRFTFDPDDEMDAAWSADGRRIVYNSRRRGGLHLYEHAADGSSDEHVIFEDALDKYPLSFTGQSLAYFSGAARNPRTQGDLWLLPLTGDAHPVPLAATPANENQGRLSPDGRWLAFASNESGRSEIYVIPASGSGGRWQVSTLGGGWPRWRQDGRELFYVSPQGVLMATPVEPSAGVFRSGSPTPLFTMAVRSEVYLGYRSSYQYDVAGNGQRFLLNSPLDTRELPLSLVVNWPSLIQ